MPPRGETMPDKDCEAERERRTCRRRVAALVSSFFAAMCRAGSRTLPRVSFSRRMATTRSWPCWRATASGVNPSCKGNLHERSLEGLSWGRANRVCAEKGQERKGQNLRGQGLVGAVSEQEADDLFVVLLRRHVEGREAVQRLHVHIRSVLDEDGHDEGLAREGGDVERRVALLRRRVHDGLPLEELSNDLAVSFLRGQMQRVEAVRVAGVYVGAGSEQLQHLLQVAGSRGAQERRAALILQKPPRSQGSRSLIAAL